MRVIERQTKATEDAAKAALLNAEALINSERAWLFVRQEIGSRDGDVRIQDPYLKPIGDPDALPTQERAAHCIFFVKNYGKTPAKIIAWRAELQLGKSAIEPPDFGVFEIPNSRFTPYFAPQDIPIPQEARFPDGRFATWEDMQSIKDLANYLWLCGFVQYEDVIGGGKQTHVTNFCYLWETRYGNPRKDYWTIAGPEWCHKAT